jgi:hypothetical protein
MELIKLKDRLHVMLIDKTDQKIGEQQHLSCNLTLLHATRLFASAIRIAYILCVLSLVLWTRRFCIHCLST